jgi:hypothetical protein
MALEIGQVVHGAALAPIRGIGRQDETAADQTGLPVAGPQQAPPLTGVGAKPLSGEALQALQGTEEPADTGSPEGDLDEDQQKQVAELKQRDQEVRRHEAAHAAAGGQFAGAPTFTYTQGPDGKRYATGGEVSIDLSPVSGDPEATARKADQIRAAALAPADPSGQDRAVAAAATKMKLDAQAEASKKQAEELEEKNGEAPEVPGAPKPEIAGPKPLGAEDDGDAGALIPFADRRPAAAAQAYGRAGSISGDRNSGALSLVA